MPRWKHSPTIVEWCQNRIQNRTTGLLAKTGGLWAAETGHGLRVIVISAQPVEDQAQVPSIEPTYHGTQTPLQQSPAKLVLHIASAARQQAPQMQEPCTAQSTS